MVMRPPKPKEIPGYMPSFLSYSIQLGLSSLYEGNAYADSGEECPACGSTHIRKGDSYTTSFDLCLCCRNLSCKHADITYRIAIHTNDVLFLHINFMA